MEIVGTGFLAARLSRISARHPGAVLLAAGVSSIRGGTPEEFARELQLVHRVSARCRSEGRMLVIFSSASHAIYGSTDEPVSEETVVAPTYPYGKHKLMVEAIPAQTGTRSLVLRVSHVVGPGQPEHQMLPAFVRQIRSGVVRLHSGAHRDLIDVHDVVEAVDGLLSLGIHDQIVNIASGYPWPIELIVKGIEARMGQSPRHEVVDVPPARTIVSTAKLHALLPGLPPIGGPDYLDRVLGRYVAGYCRGAAR